MLSKVYLITVCSVVCLTTSGSGIFIFITTRNVIQV